ncbi:MAG: pirin family protein [Janthinobacterium lividum]
MAQSVLHPAASRGHANHGWLDSYHTFSFAGYHDPSRMHFGALRVLNDDTVAGGRGFSRHPHDNMEIISIPLSGSLEHQDSLGSQAVIRQNDVQVMSAGTGVAHSEKNHSLTEAVKFLQIWVFPNQRGVAPRYAQQSFPPAERHNQLRQVVSPSAAEGAVWINQDAWFHLGAFDQGFSTEYQLKKPGHGVYAFVLEGDVTINGQALHRRDGLGLWELEKLAIQANSAAELLLMEVPMEF